MKMTSDHKLCIKNFIDENWEQFVAHVAGEAGVTEEEAEGLAEELTEALEEEVMYG
ncbi:hypothetical protein [Aeromonas phage 3]|nr:hypothetical protein [Aeromonas phage 3]